MIKRISYRTKTGQSKKSLAATYIRILWKKTIYPNRKDW